VFGLFRTWLISRVKGSNELRRAFALSHEVVVKSAFDPARKQIAFAQNHDIAVSLLKRAAVARQEMVTGTVEVTGEPGARAFDLLDYSLYSRATPITQALKDELTNLIGRLTMRW